MKKHSKYDLQLFILIGAILLFELILRLVTVKPIFTIGFVLVMLFSIVTGAVIDLVSHIFKGKGRAVVASIATVIAAILYGAQVVYNEIFHTYFTIYSMTHGAQVAQFWRDILIGMGHQAIALVTIAVVAILTVILLTRNYKVHSKGISQKTYKEKISSNEKEATLDETASNESSNEAARKHRILGRRASKSIRRSAFTTVIALALAIAVIFCGGKGANTPYEAVYKVNSIDASIKNLGFSAAAVLDMERLVFGFVPKLDTEGELNEDMELTTEYGFNEMDIDFAALAEAETDATLKQMNQYFDSVTPSKQNAYTGMFEGKNLVMVVGESYSSYAIHPIYTPTLYKMQNEGFNFTNFYNPIWGVSTSDGEYVATTGLIPKAGVWSMQESSTNSLPFTMGNQFRKLGIETRAYHNHYAEYYGRTESHPNLGYIYKGLGTGLNVKEQWPESDLEMLQLSTPEYLTPTVIEVPQTTDSAVENTATGQAITTATAVAPFHVYYMTVSGHLNYNFTGQMMCRIHKDDVEDLEMSEACRAYIASQIELDLAMEHLLNELEKVGELENTVIVISGDHYPYGLTNEQISEFLGHPVDEKFELYKSSLIIYNPGMEPETIDKYCSSLDIIPTVSNLFGLEYDSRLLMGRDIFSDTDPLVIFKDRSWITDKGSYDALTGVFTPHPTPEPNEQPEDSENNADSNSIKGSDEIQSDKSEETSDAAIEAPEITQEYIDGISARVANRFNYSTLILDRDYYRYLGL